MVSMGGQGGFSILIITVTAQRVCMSAQSNVVRAYANHHFAFVHVSPTQLFIAHTKRTGTRSAMFGRALKSWLHSVSLSTWL